MSEWTELTWEEAMGRAYGALHIAELIYSELEDPQAGGRSNIDIEKHLRRAEVKVAQAQAWVLMAGELRARHGGE